MIDGMWAGEMSGSAYQISNVLPCHHVTACMCLAVTYTHRPNINQGHPALVWLQSVPPLLRAAAGVQGRPQPDRHTGRRAAQVGAAYFSRGGWGGVQVGAAATARGGTVRMF
jgi:hypothetical protein